jgi:hypothetical protein
LPGVAVSKIQSIIFARASASSGVNTWSFLSPAEIFRRFDSYFAVSQASTEEMVSNIKKKVSFGRAVITATFQSRKPMQTPFPGRGRGSNFVGTDPVDRSV